MATTPPSRKRAAPKKAPSTSKSKTPAAPKKPAGAAVPASKASPTKGKTTAQAKPARPAPKTKQLVPRDAAGTTPDVPGDNTTAIELSPRAQRFVDEYLIDLNATQAAIRAGYSEKTARAIGCENLTKPDIQAAISQAQKERAERTAISADKALREAWNVATADARELVQVKVGCCRNCYGEGHKYQRTVGEMNRDREQWAEKGNAPSDFDVKGGIGFNPLLHPSPTCPECGGDGQSRVVLCDTRSLSPAAISLYAGAKQTKEGIEVKMHDKGAALEKVFKHLGLYEKDNEQKTDPLTALLQTITSGTNSTFKPVAHDPDHDED